MAYPQVSQGPRSQNQKSLACNRDNALMKKERIVYSYMFLGNVNLSGCAKEFAIHAIGRSSNPLALQEGLDHNGYCFEISTKHVLCMRLAV